jgi:hypothetical protein
MSSEPQDFESVRRLLVLKRHEQPPPGYFHNFSLEVIGRIRAGEGAQESSAGWGWLTRMWSAFEGNPVMAGAFGAAVCGLLLWGMVASDQIEPANLKLAQPLPLNGQTAHQPMVSTLTQQAIAGFPSTTGLRTEQPAVSLFENIRFPAPQTVSWQVPGGN